MAKEMSLPTEQGGFLSGLMDGFVSTVAPNYFQYMVKQRDAQAHAMQTQSALKQLADQASAMYDPIINDPKTSPAKKHVLRQLKAMAISGNVLLAEKYPDMVENTQKAILDADKPSSLRSDMEYAAELDPNTYTPQKIAEGIYQTHTKPSTQINFGDKPLPPSELVDEQGNRIPQPVGATTNDIVKAHGGRVYYAPKEKKQGTEKPSTDQQTRDAGFYDAMTLALPELDKLDGKANTYLGELETTLHKSSILGKAVSLGANELLTDDEKKYKTAQKQFLASVLRKQSGGAITPEEWSEYGPMYFAPPGASDDVLAQKAAFRRQATESMKRSAGKALGGNSQQKPATSGEPNIIKSETIGGKVIHYDDHGNPYIEE